MYIRTHTTRHNSLQIKILHFFCKQGIADIVRGQGGDCNCHGDGNISITVSPRVVQKWTHYLTVVLKVIAEGKKWNHRQLNHFNWYLIIELDNLITLSGT